MNERIVEEIGMLREKYPNLQHGANYDWVEIPDYPLPAGWNRKATNLLFFIPNTYPLTAPDNFYVGAGLRKQDGVTPSSYTEGQTVPVPGNWGQFSWHPEVWKPSATSAEGDNLVTFMRSVGIRLREIN
jgi:hypothetical protein